MAEHKKNRTPSNKDRHTNNSNVRSNKKPNWNSNGNRKGDVKNRHQKNRTLLDIIFGN